MCGWNYLLASHHGSVIVLPGALLKGDEITMRGYKVLTFAECTTVMTVILTVTRGM
jgi:hypothetical protein